MFSAVSLYNYAVTPTKMQIDQEIIYFYVDSLTCLLLTMEWFNKWWEVTLEGLKRGDVK